MQRAGAPERGAAPVQVGAAARKQGQAAGVAGGGRSLGGSPAVTVPRALLPHFECLLLN